MASFPTSVKSFTSKNTGDVIQAAHVNDLQDEVNAIEAGYLNGTANLNSSRATVTSLQVSGASTITTLQAAGSTFSVRPVTPPPDAALVYLDSTVTIGSSALSTVAWLAQSILTNSSMHSTGTNPERLIPQSTGLYRYVFQVSLSSTEAGVRIAGITDSSGTSIGNQTVAASSRGNVVLCEAYKRFDVVGGYAVAALNNLGHSTMSLSSGVGGTWFSLVKL
jgi:hypothetical protein